MNIFIRDLNEEIHRAAKVAAYAHGETMNDFIVRAIKTAVAKDPMAAKILRFVRNQAPTKKRSP